ncbi:MAG: ATPase, FliI/YscN family [Phycisphaerales bacterium]|nr:ATPase, FliI/YscN family [Phycisphaerales bacterium]
MPFLDAQLDAVEQAMPFGVRGRVQAVTGLTLEASDLPLPLGSLCRIETLTGHRAAEVIGIRADRTLLMPLESPAGIARGDVVSNVAAAPRIWCSDALLGRVINGFGDPIDGLGAIRADESRRLDGRSPRPLDRLPIRQPITTSLRAIDALHTCGLGQRMGIFSGPGVGKSTLMSAIAKHTSADVSVVALIGERGREVQEFIENRLGPEGMARCCIIFSTGDEAPLLRVRAAKAACAVAEYFRDRGLHVMLMMDSLTRLCQAQRQIGLAAGEPPATKGFPPSVFAMIPELLERAGNTPVGSITGFYTVLVEGDDFNEPIPDAVKGITDGHFWLNRKLADRGHFPALDVTQSISRVRGDVTDKEHQRQARRVLSLWAVYKDIEDLVNIGAYAAGANPEYDLAVQARPRIQAFLRQEGGDPRTMEQSRQELAELSVWLDQMDKVVRAQKAAPPARGQR